MVGAGRSIGTVARVARWLALAGAVLVALVPLVAQGALTSTRLDWGGVPTMRIVRQELAVAAAANGKLYAIGGLFDSTGEPGACTGFCANVEEYDPSSNTWAVKTSMPHGRRNLAVAVLNGKVYAAGGENTASIVSGGCAGFCASLEEYDPATNTWAIKADMPTRRMGLGLAAANGKLYAIGGSDGTTIYNKVEEYDPATNTWVTKRVMPTPRTGLGLATAPNGKLYAIGGLNGARLGVVEAYDPATDTWTTTIQQMPTPRSELGVALAPNGRLYAIGGRNANSGGVLKTVEELDPTTGSWVTGKADMPLQRWGLGLATAPDGKLYAIGGNRATQNPVTQVQAYDPVANTWSATRVDASTAFLPRFGAAVASLNNKVYVFGGVDQDLNQTNTVQEYNPDTKTWRLLTPMLGRRHSHRAAVLNNKIYLVGGYNAGFLRAVEQFDPTGNGGLGSWLGSPTIGQLQAPRGFAGVATGSNGRIYAVGGGYDSGVRTSTEEYNPSTNQWTTPANAFLGVPRDTLDAAVVRVNGQEWLYAIGGQNYGGAGSGTSNQLTATTAVERLPLPATGTVTGSWSGPSASIAQLPQPRMLHTLTGAPNGKLYVMAGSSGSTQAPAEVSNVFEYDPSINIWSSFDRSVVPVRSGEPIPRYGHGAALLGERLFSVGGSVSSTFDGRPFGGQTVDEGVLTELPSVGAGGPYTVQSGQAVQVSATGSDPEGGTLSYAWDLNNDLVYETPGQTVTFSAAGLSAGTRTVRVRSMDPNGAFSVSETTATVTAAPEVPPAAPPAPPAPPSIPPSTGPCSPRPNVQVQTSRVGPGQIRASISGGQGALSGVLRVGYPTRPLENATVDVDGGPTGITSAQDVPITGAAMVLTVTRTGAGAVMVPIAVTDGCGEWRSFVGFGPGM